MSAWLSIFIYVSAAVEMLTWASVCDDSAAVQMSTCLSVCPFAAVVNQRGGSGRSAAWTDGHHREVSWSSSSSSSIKSIYSRFDFCVMRCLCVSMLWTVLKVLMHVFITVMRCLYVSVLCQPFLRCWCTFSLLCYALSVCLHAVWTVLKVLIHVHFFFITLLCFVCLSPCYMNRSYWYTFWLLCYALSVSPCCEPFLRCWYTFWLLYYALSVSPCCEPFLRCWYTFWLLCYALSVSPCCVNHPEGADTRFDYFVMRCQCVSMLCEPFLRRWYTSRSGRMVEGDRSNFMGSDPSALNVLSGCHTIQPKLAG